MGRSNIIEFANSQIGITEKPAGSNIVKYNDWYYDKEAVGCDFKNYYGASGMYLAGKRKGSAKAFAWCGTFVSYLYAFAGHPLPNKIHYRIYHVPTVQNYLAANGYRVAFEHAQEGDIIIFDFNHDNSEDHIGIVVGFDGEYFTCIEGNTSVGGSQSNGGMVCLKRRHKSIVEGVYNVLD